MKITRFSETNSSLVNKISLQTIEKQFQKH